MLSMLAGVRHEKEIIQNVETIEFVYFSEDELSELATEKNN